jgi:hypothetical protein
MIAAADVGWTHQGRFRRIVSAAAVGVSLAVASAVATLAAQAGSASRSNPPAVVLRTPDGRPDLQGVYTHGTLTPFERPAALGTKAFYTDEEAREEERKEVARRSTRGEARAGSVGGDNEAYVDSGYTALSSRQTSLIDDPPDGRLPLRPDAERRRDFNLTSMDTFESMSRGIAASPGARRCCCRLAITTAPESSKQRVMW